MIVRDLTTQEWTVYKAPFHDTAARKQIHALSQEGGKPYNNEIVAAYGRWLSESPVLLIGFTRTSQSLRPAPTRGVQSRSGCAGVCGRHRLRGEARQHEYPQCMAVQWDLVSSG